MSKQNNLTDFLTDIANTIRSKKGYTSTQKINPQNFSSEITNIRSGDNAEYTSINMRADDIYEFAIPAGETICYIPMKMYQDGADLNVKFFRGDTLYKTITTDMAINNSYGFSFICENADGNSVVHYVYSSFSGSGCEEIDNVDKIVIELICRSYESVTLHFVHV